MSIRITPEVRQWLEEAAAVHGTSLSDEMESRLRQSFVEDEGLRQRLTAAADEHEISVDSEIRQRLVQSFDDEDGSDFAKQLGGSDNYALFRILAYFAWCAETDSQANLKPSRHKRWLHDPLAFDLFVKAVDRLLSVLRPEGSVEPPHEWRGLPIAIWPEAIVAGVLDQLQRLRGDEFYSDKPTKGGRPATRYSREAKTWPAVRRGLGSVVERLDVGRPKK